MADKAISALTAATTVGGSDLAVIETSGGNSRKVRAAVAGIACGTAFPGSPTTEDRFYRTDLRIEFFYDGTRWLSTQVSDIVFVLDTSLPLTATSAMRANNPGWNDFDIYIEKFKTDCINTATTAANYATVQLSKSDGLTDTNVGSSFTTQGDTQNAHVGHSVTINSVVTSAHEGFAVGVTETGAFNFYITASMSYRRVG